MKKPMNLTKGQLLRKALTHAALYAQDQIEKGRIHLLTSGQIAIREAMDRKLAREPRFAWQ
jgi:hypothetical protein